MCNEKLGSILLRIMAESFINGVSEYNLERDVKEFFLSYGNKNTTFH